MKATVQKETQPAVERNAREGFVSPAVNIIENEDGYVLEAEMPGVSKEGLEITLEGTELTLIGHRNAPTPSGDVLFRESGDSSYRRAFELDPAIDTARVSAKMEQGILTLTLPKSEKAKPCRITVE
jgi:HSP20 family protein